MTECEELTDLEKLQLKYVGLLLSRTNNKVTSLYGPVKIKNTWFNIKMVCPNFPSIKDVQLQVQQSLNIETYAIHKLNIPEDCSTVEQLIEKLPDLIEAPKSLNHILVDENWSHKNIYDEIVKVYSPTEYEVNLADNYSLIRFSKFVQNEEHFLEVGLPSLKLLDHSLPMGIDWQEMLSKAKSLSEMLQQFKVYLEDLRPFYENFIAIDELCHVVEPTLPTTKANFRLFVLKERVFLKLQFADPLTPLSSMSVNIIGPTSEVTELRRIYSVGLHDWDAELDVHKNLLRIFDMCFFPMPPAADSQTSRQFCNICYCYKLDEGEIPIVSCDNNNCSLIFHPACLKEWFNTLADGKTFLNVSLGACPFCKSKLSTSFQEILAHNAYC